MGGVYYLLCRKVGVSVLCVDYYGFVVIHANNGRSEVTGAVKKTVASELVPGLGFGYDYDGMGNRISSTVGTAPNEATTTYGRNALNQYTTISTPGKADILARSDNPVTVEVDGNPVVTSNAGNLHNAHSTIISR